MNPRLVSESLLLTLVMVLALVPCGGVRAQPVLVENTARTEASAIAVSASGAFVATASGNNSIDIWLLKTGRRITSIESEYPVLDLALSPDGATLALLHPYGLALYDVKKTALIKTFEGGKGDINTERKRFVMFGGATLFATWDDGLSRFDLRSGTRTELAKLDDDETSIAVGADGSWQVATIELHRVKLSGAMKGELPVVRIDWIHAAPMTGRLIVGGPRRATLWDLKRLTAIKSYDYEHDGGLNPGVGAMFSTDGKTLLLANGSSVRVIDALTGRVRTTLDSGIVSAFQVSNNGGPIITASKDAPVTAWNARTGNAEQTLGVAVPNNPVVHVLPSGSTLFVSDDSGKPFTWNMKTGVHQPITAPDGVRLPTVAIERDRAAWIGRSGHLYWLDVGADTPLQMGKLNQLPAGWGEDFGAPLLALPGDGSELYAIDGGRLRQIPIIKPREVSALSMVKPRLQALRAVYGGLLALPETGSAPLMLSGARGNATRSLTALSSHSFTDLDVGASGFVTITDAGHAILAKFDSPEPVLLTRSAARRATLLGATPFVAVARFDGSIELWDSKTKTIAATWPAHRGMLSTLASLAGGRLLVTSASGDSQIKIWSVPAGRLELTLIPLKDGGWVVATPDGRFDTSDIETAHAVAWRMPDAPLHPLAPDIFLRDFYQPGLLATTWACLTEPGAADRCRSRSVQLPTLASLNRVQPSVSIAAVRPGAHAGEAIVDVRVSPAHDPSQPNGKTRTDAYDLRLFRNGQLVWQWPPSADGSDARAAWRTRTRVTMPAGSTAAKISFRVALPAQTAGQDVQFTAYAFNEDRVKSETARARYAVPAPLEPPPQPAPRPKAYVVAIGVNGYAAPGRNLRFAVQDSHAMLKALSRLDGYEIVPVALNSAGNDPSQWHAIKENIREVLARLAGRPASEPSRWLARITRWLSFLLPIDRFGAVSDIPGIDRVARATPDDLVIITFSGHGHTDPGGAFYILPSDSGVQTEITAAALAKFISGQELSEWLRPIDAGRMAMIIDACQSAASVAQPGFRPGPMGDRGLGQLAYDKSMQILAASHGVALESGQLGQGLLTFALVGESAARRAARDPDGTFTLTEWLRHGEQQTPKLHDDIRNGRKEIVSLTRDPKVPAAYLAAMARANQAPAFFNFARKFNPEPIFARADAAP